MDLGAELIAYFGEYDLRYVFKIRMYWEADSRSAPQEILCLLLKPNDHFRVQNVRHRIPSCPSCIKTKLSHPISLKSILMLSSHLWLVSQMVSSPPGFRIKLYILYISHLPLRATSCAYHPILWFRHPSNIWWCVHITKFLIMQFSASSDYFLSPRFICSPLHIVLECRQATAIFLFWVDHSCQTRPWQGRRRIFPKICYGW